MERTFAFSPAIGGPAVANGRVFVPANGNGLFAFDAKTGEQLWMVASPGDKYGHSSPKVRDGRIYVGCLGAKGEVRCVSAEDGKELWACATGYEIYDSSPALGEGFLGIGSVPSTLNVIALTDGKLLAQHRLPPGHFLSTPAADGRELYAATYSDEVVAFDVRA